MMRHKALVVGFGFMGAVHAGNLVNSPDWELAGIVDPRPGDIFENLQNIGNLGKLDLPVAAFRRVPVFQELAAAIAATGAECAILAVPLAQHVPLTRAALQAGLHCLLEKPFAPTEAEGRMLLGLAQSVKRTLMVAHCVRFDPVWQYLAESIRSGRYGAVRRLECRRMAGEPAWGGWRDPEIRRASGGALFDMTIHDLDFVRSLGEIAACEVWSQQREFRELRLRWQDSAAQIRVNGGFLHQGSAFSAEYLAEFESATLRYHSFQPRRVHVGTGQGAETLEFPGCGYANELAYFGECLDRNKPPVRCRPEESLEAIALCRKIQETGEV